MVRVIMESIVQKDKTRSDLTEDRSTLPIMKNCQNAISDL